MTATPSATDPHHASLVEVRVHLRSVEVRVRAVVDARRSTETGQDDRFRGLYISDDDVDALLLAGQASTDGLASDDVANRASSDVPTGSDTGSGMVPPEASRILRLCRAFGLDSLDLDILMIAVAADLDARFERLYAYLQDDVTRRRPSIGTALEICALSTWSIEARRHFAVGAPLLAGGLVGIEDTDRPLLTRALRVPDRIVEYLLGGDAPDASIRELITSVPTVELVATTELTEVLRRGVALAYFQDRVGSATVSVAAGALAATGARAMTLDLDRMAAADDPALLARAAAREARLLDAGIVAGPIDALARVAPGAIRALADVPVPVVLVGRVAWEAAWSERVPWVADAPLATTDDRKRLWTVGLDPLDAAQLAESMAGFRLSPEQIQRAKRSAHVRSLAQGDGPRTADLQAGARAENASGLDRLARRVEPRARWDDLILPDGTREELTELGARARRRDLVLGEWGLGGGATHGRSVTALFAGDPGTGKTMAAEVVAAELGLDLYVIDLSSVVDKYIGETEKNLDRIFTEADRVNGVLLFDEADAIFGQRSEVRDARDRYANVEIAYLLQRMEQFDGLAVLTTNLRANIDEAFLRRLDAVVDFPMPEVADRLAIWHLHLPERIPTMPDVDLRFMAEHFELAGGHIRNICLTAAYLAADRDGRVSMADIVHGAEREYSKMGRLTVEAEFGPYLPLLRGGDAVGSERARGETQGDEAQPWTSSVGAA
jgi:hypothetical protein